MDKTILSKNQTKFLELISQNKSITDNFYLGGGTALAEYYLHHRLSEDLDFFSEREFDPIGISAFLKTIQKEFGIKKIDYQQSFNRNLFFIYLKDEVIKTEFTYYPFILYEKGLVMGALRIDSLIDISINKLFTIYQNPRSRDFIDLYMILEKKKWKLKDLILKAQEKFDTYIDPLQLGVQFRKAGEVLDYPKMLKKIDNKIWQDYFMKLAKTLSKDIFKE